MPETSPASCVLVAANRLPYSVSRVDSNWKLAESPGGLVSAMKGVDLKMDWIGWPGNEVPPEDQPELESQLSEKSDHFSLHPVFLTKDDQENYYNGFANQMIWPNFHDLCPMMHYSEKHWMSYQEVNRKFASNIHLSLRDRWAENADEDLLVWVHDYQLMLVPGLLRELLRRESPFMMERVKIGFFLHVPFPCAQIFESFPAKIRKEILEGLLASDLIGMHDESYVDNFLENVRRLMPAERTFFAEDKKCVLNRDHVTHLGTYPIGIEPKFFEDCLEGKPAPAASEILKKCKPAKIILGVDRLDPSKGLVEKLRGYADYLEKNPKARGNTVLVQIAVPSRTAIEDYSKLKEEMFALVKEINEKYSLPGSPAPVELLYRNFQVADLATFYAGADVLLVTSLKDGMNLVSFEYTVCQQKAVEKKASQKFGSLILSRYAGAASYLLGAVQVDPHSPEEISQALHRALTMSKKEKEVRLMANFAYVRSKTAKIWANEFISDLRGLVRVSSDLEMASSH